MNSRERILCSIGHREPDRVARDLGAMQSSSIAAMAYGNLVRHLSFGGGGVRVYDVVQQLARIEDGLLDRLKIDAIDAGRVFHTEASYWKPFTLPDGALAYIPEWFNPARLADGALEVSINGRPVSLMIPDSMFFDQIYFPYGDGFPNDFSNLAEAMQSVQWGAFAQPMWQQTDSPGYWENLRERLMALRAQTDRAIVITCGCNLLEWGSYLRGMDNFFCDIAAEPETVERFLDAIMELHLSKLEKVCAAAGDIADIAVFGDDLGMDNGPLMQPETYRRLFKPRQARLCEYAHKHSRMKTFLHSCGSIYKLLPDIIEAGFDIINPVQFTARDMEPARLKKEFGRDITFWGGGCDTRRVLNHASVSEVKDHVRRQVEIMAPGGGFVFNTVHNIMPDVPPENILAMFDALDEYGRL